ncbi:hypothetical protein [Psychrobium sp. 1_MG-2023]|uniref:hypothetical protein n=1 Tax=Psychrobium sp. 1_MG-2023 TaxID=3062624 RepID=UPI000C31FC61|nr:hypothetical protein [Psychrobium sp. 1_MG-2023]MDP2561511.1 hypothetical protein [Psychrobium sp. 1_MG-2023]PKF57775.1 hypothetical protein CW748_06160 [Alteromonadales bacterium alter-6D02]
MPQFIEVDIIIPALDAAIQQVALLSLDKIGLDVSDFPFWLAIIGFPLAVFDTCTKHIATALNIVLHKTHRNLREFTGVLIPVFSSISIFIFIMYVSYQHGLISRQITQNELSQVLYYLLLFLIFIVICLVIASLSRLTGQGNYVTGVGFLMGTASVFIEVIQKYGLIGQISCGVAVGLTFWLWVYGRNYNIRAEKLAQAKALTTESRTCRRKPLSVPQR